MAHVPAGAASAEAGAPRRSLVLAGGGMRVAYQAGVLRALFESGLTFAHADGTSGGTINLAMLLSGLTPTEMCERWRTLEVKDFLSLMPLGEYLRGAQVSALSDADGIVRDVFPHLGIDPARIRAAEGIEGTFNLCNFTDKVNEAVSHRAIDGDLLVAGISLPILMPAVHRGNTTYIDAVWIRDANLPEAVRRGAEEIWLVWCIGNTPEYRPGLLRQYVHMIEMSANGSLFEDLQRIVELNARINAGEHVDGRTQPVRVHVIKPEVALPLDPDFFAGRIDAESLVAIGYRDAVRYLRTMPSDGLPLTPELTKMRDAGDSLLYRETFEGPFALGATDPRQGAEAGVRDDTSLLIRSTVEVDGIDRFIDDPGHEASLTGRVEFSPIGVDLLSTDGSFNLVAAAGGSRRAAYELAFRANGRDLCLAGRKELHDDPGFDAWSDLTTVFATLHEGLDTSGPVIGAGILRQEKRSIVKTLAALHPTNIDSLVGRAAAIERFVRFFGGELWDAYT
jgi:predicted patatin/cPLA2 family phospholipase